MSADNSGILEERNGTDERELPPAAASEPVVVAAVEDGEAQQENAPQKDIIVPVATKNLHLNQKFLQDLSSLPCDGTTSIPIKIAVPMLSADDLFKYSETTGAEILMS
ncbi:hypothetical protein BV898_13720 [Hypsibius exemplaris]|uniref:Uncharacterized protein n=1 Tax=Hypsibius exemplaris TaxID=2072580 RepID=A0A1W0W9W5_HYPEX|nr:hypothetical protein BV898_13720 [Hypsibius exemplaris]